MTAFPPTSTQQEFNAEPGVNARSIDSRALSKYEKPRITAAIWQLTNTLVPYAGLWALMVWLLRSGASFWQILPLVLLAAGLLVRVFIFFHDCCHGSFFASRRANKALGLVSGILTFTPFEGWQHPHNRHHATAGDLDRRGVGDVWTLTVDEYLAAPRKTQLAYRIFRHPLFLFVLGPPAMFLIGHRVPRKGASKRERQSVFVTNLAILGIVTVASLTIGLKTYLLIQIPVMSIAGALGVWMFYIQHQFEGVYWARHGDWDPTRAALEGSSYYRLPRVLQWFTGNIGLHHIHHLRARIPNYNLERCLNEIPALQAVVPLTIRTSLRSLWLNVYDESSGKLVTFRDIPSLGSRGPLVKQ